MSNCQNCILCNGLSNQSYCIQNKQVGKTAYEEFLKSFDLGDYQKLLKYKKEFQNIISQGTMGATFNLNSENIIGNTCVNSANGFLSFDLQACHDVRYTTACFESQDMMDISAFGEYSYKMYEGSSVGKNSSHLTCCNMI